MGYQLGFQPSFLPLARTLPPARLLAHLTASHRAPRVATPRLKKKYLRFPATTYKSSLVAERSTLRSSRTTGFDCPLSGPRRRPPRGVRPTAFAGRQPFFFVYTEGAHSVDNLALYSAPFRPHYCFYFCCCLLAFPSLSRRSAAPKSSIRDRDCTACFSLSLSLTHFQLQLHVHAHVAYTGCILCIPSQRLSHR